MQPHRSQGRASGFGGGSNKIKKFYFSFVIISVMIPLFYSIICNNANKYGLQKQHYPRPPPSYAASPEHTCLYLALVTLISIKIDSKYIEIFMSQISRYISKWTLNFKIYSFLITSLKTEYLKCFFRRKWTH